MIYICKSNYLNEIANGTVHMILIKDKSITDLIKYYMGMISICLMALAFPGDANAKADQVISDLKVLSLMIKKQLCTRQKKITH